MKALLAILTLLLKNACLNYVIVRFPKPHNQKVLVMIEVNKDNLERTTVVSYDEQEEVVCIGTVQGLFNLAGPQSDEENSAVSIETAEEQLTLLRVLFGGFATANWTARNCHALPGLDFARLLTLLLGQYLGLRFETPTYSGSTHNFDISP